MEALLGPILKTKSGDKPTGEVTQGKVVALYFSAHWCPPCRGFTPTLGGIYNNLKKAGKPFEIVFVSSDRDEGSFNEYYNEMPWVSLPFADRERKASLSSKFKVQGIPTLVILDEQGKLITTDGRAAVTQDPQGQNFPWIPKSIPELLGPKLRKPDGSIVEASTLAGKTLALYFSAHWCPPCRMFTPELGKLYKTMKASRDDFEFIFISSDRDEASFNEYHGEQPWLALPFERRGEKEEISERFGVQGIPSLVVIEADGTIINKNARGFAAEDPTGEQFPWRPKKAAELSKSVESNGFDVNEKTAVIVLCDGASAAVKQQVTTTVLEVATEVSICEDPDFIFFSATEHRGPVPQVKGLLTLPEELVEVPRIVILDIPDNGGFYLLEPAELTATSLKAALDAYKNKTLTRRQLSQR